MLEEQRKKLEEAKEEAMEKNIDPELNILLKNDSHTEGMLNILLKESKAWAKWTEEIILNGFI